MGDKSFMSLIDNFFKNLLMPIDFNVITYVSFGFIGSLFIVIFLLKIIIKGFDKKFTFIYLASSLVVVFCYRYVISILEQPDSGWFLLTAVVFLFLLPLCLFGRKTKKVDSKEFIKFIDQKIAEDKPEDLSQLTERKECFDEEKMEVVDGLNLSHVKNILKRLDYFDLSQSDRRQVREVEMAIFQAERRFDDLEVKEKLNDGLGALLKIMAKYGV